MKILIESNKAIVKTTEQKIKNKFSWKWPSNIKRRRFQIIKIQHRHTVML